MISLDQQLKIIKILINFDPVQNKYLENKIELPYLITPNNTSKLNKSTQGSITS